MNDAQHVAWTNRKKPSWHTLVHQVSDSSLSSTSSGSTDLSSTPSTASETSSGSKDLSCTPSTASEALRAPQDAHWEEMHRKIHSLGLCTTCAFVKLNKPCVNGWRCRFCHLDKDVADRGFRPNKVQRKKCNVEALQLDTLCGVDDVGFRECVVSLLRRYSDYAFETIKAKLRVLMIEGRLSDENLAFALDCLSEKRKPSADVLPLRSS
eukprot:TRINITY_DN54428_c0_g1_i1.p1 TRINITY_DN54428_c0_g1~~TRINITY_DN54428_c0_g1_i1.p1  ORF type:complete len:209 (-),score=21.72 TRINITY_DN54428_c0_g1_i1:276-902(-)